MFQNPPSFEDALQYYRQQKRKQTEFDDRMDNNFIHYIKERSENDQRAIIIMMNYNNTVLKPLLNK
jgi:hypothetical protein